MNEKLLKLKEEIKATTVIEGKTNPVFMDNDVVLMLGPDSIAVARKRVSDGTFEENKISVDKVIKVNFEPGNFFFHTRKGIFMCPIYANDAELKVYCKEFKRIKNLETTSEEFDIFTYEPTGQIPKITDEVVDEILKNAKEYYEKTSSEGTDFKDHVSHTREFKRLVDDINSPYDPSRLEAKNSYVEQYKPMHAMYKDAEQKWEEENKKPEGKIVNSVGSITPEESKFYEETVKELEDYTDCDECDDAEVEKEVLADKEPTCTCDKECNCAEGECTCGDDCECEACKAKREEKETNFFDENVPDNEMTEEETKELEQKIQETMDKIEETKKKGKRKSGWKVFFIILLLLAIAGLGAVYVVNYSGLDLPFEFDLTVFENLMAGTVERAKEVFESITNK